MKLLHGMHAVSRLMIGVIFPLERNSHVEKILIHSSYQLSETEAEELEIIISHTVFSRAFICVAAYGLKKDVAENNLLTRWLDSQFPGTSLLWESKSNLK